MANIHLNGSSNSHINFADPSMPKYIGARAVVTRSENGVVIWMKDYKGETTETVAEAIQSITTNIDGSLTFTLPDGRTITTGSLAGPQGEQGIQGPTGNGIASVEKTGTSGLVDTYTITYTDGDTETFTVTNGQDGQDGADGADGADGVGIASIVFNDDYTMTIIDTDGNEYDSGSLRGPQGETGATGSTGPQGPTGPTGNGIASIAKTASVGLVDTYTITYTNGTTTTFNVTNGQDGTGSLSDVLVDNSSVVRGGVAYVDLTGKADISSLAAVATSGDYDDLTDKPTIPTNTNQLTNGAGFITSPNVVYCTCATEQSTVAKVATIVSGSLTTLTTGTQAIVKFTNANAATNPTLQVGSTAAKNIKRYGTSAPSTSSAGSWNGGSCIYFVYDGSDWQMIGFLNSTYSAISKTNIESSSSTSTGLITGQRAAQAVAKHESINDVTVGGTSVVSSKVAAIPAIPAATSTTPAMDGTASAGSETTWAKGDHVHPHDTSKQDTLVSGTSIKTVTGTTILGSGDLLPSAVGYTTTVPSAANTSGLKFVLCDSEPATKYDGWVYLIKES